MDGTAAAARDRPALSGSPAASPRGAQGAAPRRRGQGRDAAPRRRARGHRRAGRAVERQCRAWARRAGRCRRRADAQDRLCLGLCRRHQRAGDPARREDRQATPMATARRSTTRPAARNRTSPPSRLARFYWKVQDKPNKTKIISRMHGYHGVTMAAMSATGMAAYHKMFGPLVPGFIQVRAALSLSLAGQPGMRHRRRRGGREGDPRRRARRRSRR